MNGRWWRNFHIFTNTGHFVYRLMVMVVLVVMMWRNTSSANWLCRPLTVCISYTHTHTHSILSLHKWSCFSLLEYCSIDVLICFLIKNDVFSANYLNFSHFTFNLSWLTNWVIFEQQQQEHLWMHLEFSFQVYWMRSLLTTVHLVLMFPMMLLLWHYGHLLLRSFPLNWRLLEIYFFWYVNCFKHYITRLFLSFCKGNDWCCAGIWFWLITSQNPAAAVLSYSWHQKNHWCWVFEHFQKKESANNWVV
jgi:hypothetical protein